MSAPQHNFTYIKLQPKDTSSRTHLLCRQVPRPDRQLRMWEHSRQVISLQDHEVHTTTKELHVQQDRHSHAPDPSKCCLAYVWVRPDAPAAVHTCSKEVGCVACDSTCSANTASRVGWVSSEAYVKLYNSSSLVQA